MAYKSLRDFIALLEAEGELVRVSEPVSTHLAMTEIQTRLLAGPCQPSVCVAFKKEQTCKWPRTATFTRRSPSFHFRRHLPVVRSRGKRFCRC